MLLAALEYLKGEKIGEKALEWRNKETKNRCEF